MKERIQELARQAGAQHRLNLGVEEFCFEHHELKKFAELIVEECVQTLINNMPERYTNEAAEEDWDKGYDRAMKDCVHHILDHFGVEE